ncbi:hypothetical protein EDD22DRAFT_905272, partial [Suillus occidentalis]
ERPLPSLGQTSLTVAFLIVASVYIYSISTRIDAFPVSIFRPCPFHLTHQYHVAYFLIVSSTCNWWLEGDRL